MNELKRKMKMAEDRQKANDIIRQFDKVTVNLDNGIAKCRDKAKECLIKRNDMAGFRTFARSMKYYQNMKRNIETIRNQFENYLIQVEVASTFVGLKDVLASTAKMMDSMPSLKKNNKDFMKFKKSIMKGQISMESINDMMANLDPSTDSELTEDELNMFKDEILSSTNATNVTIGNTNTNTQTNGNEDFFSELDV